MKKKNIHTKNGQSGCGDGPSAEGTISALMQIIVRHNGVWPHALKKHSNWREPLARLGLGGQRLQFGGTISQHCHSIV